MSVSALPIFRDLAHSKRGVGAADLVVHARPLQQSLCRPTASKLLCTGELRAEMSHSVVRESAISVSFGGTASGLLQALDDVSDAGLEAFVHKPLDNAGLPDYCDEACLEKSVWVRAPKAPHHDVFRVSGGCMPVL